MATAWQIAEEFLLLAKTLEYPGFAMRAHLVCEITQVHVGDFGAAIEHFEKAYSLYEHKRHLDDAFLYTQNPGVVLRCFVAWALWCFGKPDEALDRVWEAVTLARELSEPYGLAHAQLFAAVVHQLRREEELAGQYADAVLAVSREHGLIMYEAMAMVL